MRNEPVTMNEFADSIREELHDDLGVLFPGIKVVVQQVDKIQGDSYLGIRIDRQDGMASPVLNLEPHFKDMRTFKPYEKVVSDILDQAETVLRDMPQITLDDLNDYSQLKDNLIMQVISVEIGRRDLEVILGNLSLTIAKMERTQEALKDAADLIRTALQEDDTDKADCENCFLPCRHNPNIIMRHEDELDKADRELLEHLREVAEAVRNTGTDPDEAEKELQKDMEPVSEAAPENAKSPEDEDEAESLAIELLKAVFSVLAETIENRE